MKSVNQFNLGFLTLLVIFAILSISCDKKDPPPDDEHDLQVTFTYTPDPAVIDTLMTLTFKVEHYGEQVEIINHFTDVGIFGNTSQDEIYCTADSTGHYNGNYTFTEAGEYEIHFNFEHVGRQHKEVFSLTVQ